MKKLSSARLHLEIQKEKQREMELRRRDSDKALLVCASRENVTKDERVISASNHEIITTVDYSSKLSRKEDNKKMISKYN